ncbi:hypothetical protein HZA45_03000 [Candidatus Peregrinibacteria bacterium]|nr:hypothetical protein [Candidatus Peregrinibacteria bacterium]
METFHTHIVTIRTRILLTLVSLSLPLTAAAAPSPVTGIRAERNGGQINVSWQKLPESEAIAYYRIFFSGRSIVDNNGQYDDFDIAEGTAGTHTLSNAPISGTLYISVLAVNDKSEESPVFAEEVTVTGTVPEAPVVPSPAGTGSGPPAPEPELPIDDSSGTFSILSAQAVSSTGVLVTFSAPVQITMENAAKAFGMKDASGTILAIDRLVLSGSTVTIITAPQDGMKVYQLQAHDLKGTGSGGIVLILDTRQETLLFAGFGGSGNSGAQLPADPRSPEISNLILRGEAQEKSGFTAEAGWEMTGNSAMIDHFIVSQTTDHGATFGLPQSLPATSQHIRIPSIPGGAFGIKVQAALLSGEVTAGLTESIDLTPAQTESAPTLPASVTPVKTITAPEPVSLTQSGMTPFALIAIAGAAVGFAIVRRRMTVPV